VLGWPVKADSRAVKSLQERARANCIAYGIWEAKTA